MVLPLTLIVSGLPILPAVTTGSGGGGGAAFLPPPLLCTIKPSAKKAWLSLTVISYSLTLPPRYFLAEICVGVPSCVNTVSVSGADLNSPAGVKNRWLLATNMLLLSTLISSTSFMTSAQVPVTSPGSILREIGSKLATHSPSWILLIGFCLPFAIITAVSAVKPDTHN